VALLKILWLPLLLRSPPVFVIDKSHKLDGKKLQRFFIPWGLLPLNKQTLQVSRVASALFVSSCTADRHTSCLGSRDFQRRELIAFSQTLDFHPDRSR
jgi:hypothetical protein